VARAREILTGLERDELSRGGRPSLSGAPTASQQQLGLFVAPAGADDLLRRRLREIDIDNLTPVQALTLLADLQKDVGE
jgi:DNA mismatch repair protein MutS